MLAVKEEVDMVKDPRCNSLKILAVIRTSRRHPTLVVCTWDSVLGNAFPHPSVILLNCFWWPLASPRKPERGDDEETPRFDANKINY